MLFQLEATGGILKDAAGFPLSGAFCARHAEGEGVASP